ncbi:MAG TPA: hypothetical protein VGI79_10260 [Caulobacteraceae bacterium]|jgi:hypothetical protein
MVSITAGAARAARPTFYVWMSAAFILIAFGGFVPTYWAKLASGTFTGHPITQIHGALFFSWTLFYFFQTWLVASGRTLDHRTWGVAGVSLATAMGITIVLAAINAIKVGEAIGMGDAARRFSVVPLTALVVFTGLFAAAICNTKRPEVHKRLMILLMIPLMHAATARIFMTLFSPPGAVGPPPVIVAVPPGLLVCVLGVAAMAYDWRTRGRVHPVYLIGVPLMALYIVALVPIGNSAPWMAIAKAVESLTG